MVGGIAGSRRDFLRKGFLTLSLCIAGTGLPGCSVIQGCGGGGPRRRISNLDNFGPLQEADRNGVRLPEGFSSKIVRRSGEPASPGAPYLWHFAPDGGATFATRDRGWIYVSNSEVRAGEAGVGALRFDAGGQVIASYPILSGSERNCAGGPTPWGTWLSCEETKLGRVWECDPLGIEEAVAYPALGIFAHEAVAVDPENGHLYLTEDELNGGLYRFVPDQPATDGRLNLEEGTLEIARVLGEGPDGVVEWVPIPDPTFSGDTATRSQVSERATFRGGEGIWYAEGVVYFTTKWDNRVWAYEIGEGMLSLLYDDERFVEEGRETPVLDNITVSAQGDLLIAEDGGDLQIVGISPAERDKDQPSIVRVLQLEGHAGSEIAGPAFDPSGTRLYFSSQRGEDGAGVGLTYEVTGPFFL